MRLVTLGLCSWALLLLGSIPAIAQSRNQPIIIESVRVGFPAGPFSVETDPETNLPSPLWKTNQWTPIAVQLKCQAAIEGPLSLVVESPDTDQLIASFRVPLPPIAPGQTLLPVEIPQQLYAKPGSNIATITVRVFAGDVEVAMPYRMTPIGNPSNAQILLAVGSKLGGIRVTRPKEANAPENTTQRPRDLGSLKLASAENIGDLPDQWFGYSGVDLVILTTGSSDSEAGVIQQLFSRENTARRQALLEWVRRGGKVLISVGRNWNLINAIPGIDELIPVRIPATQRLQVDGARLLWNTRQGLQEHRLTTQGLPAGSKISLVPLLPRTDRVSKSLMQLEEKIPQKGQSLVVQSPLGLGKVTVVGFDLDTPPFSSWSTPEVFWDWILSESGLRIDSGTETETYRAYGGDDDKGLERMLGTLDEFEGVTVIGFGIIALLLLIYILIIGPGDYLFLKHIVKRLEFTWITFPVLVVVISVVAYFTARSIKGGEVLINKIDLVDIDLQTQRVYGETWLNIFSPEIQSYQLGVTPITPGWGMPAKPGSQSTTLISSLGTSRAGSVSLFRRNYRTRVDVEAGQIGDALENVPIQVWSTKAFTAQWSTGLDPAKPLIVSSLRHPDGSPGEISGTITSNLPIDLEDVQLFYRNRIYAINSLVAGIPVPLVRRESSEVAADWMRSTLAALPQEQTRRAQRRYSYTQNSAPYRLWESMFADAISPQTNNLGTLRRLDQSWRLLADQPDEAILVAKRIRLAGPSAEIEQAPGAVTQLWLSELPGGATPRTPAPGRMRQDTYIRIFIPVLNQPGEASP
ncbi:hypothetical protein [Tuwongella immobilis]|uniref:Uncharacterized protein n=1 Tax=Tuwongella immobilis TaxID=692036 RepID=A0A6C2YRK3_9BACT|nr:hypothetical protein [Tuwongella immobilis]VIP04116.1 Uncharacterized protein OS=Singulisphaera acidiphila (strain ATCC BAA-1392 / DSM 18658 / VKM B-2454 / MOB10) GN=Sinac_0577 PE=4 SV=1 [Tuwongella immobilis]VTS05599.1 Uncharacterized protein OS=Singulisphaera acidiphila (strain ATCC BAA-1392 / DSM 18658 / VKM B-2454 / MOB10) GN=Sinac_0577 PE=4 SV=1 [Tuwongella immobilis]